MNSLKVSIIIPVYNVEDYLEECVESILCQGYDNVEIILVDDGSPDRCPAMCDEYAGKYDFIKVVHKENGGLSSARNAGIPIASGDYILFIDSDDFIESKALKKIMDCVNENHVDVVFLEAQKVFPDGTTEPMGDGILRECVRDKTREDVFRHLSQCPKYPASTCTKLIKKSLFDNNDLLFEEGLLSEDLDWCLRLLLAAESFDCLPIMYYNYRQNRKDSITNSIKIKNLSDILYILGKWIKNCDELSSAEKSFVLSTLAYEYPIVLYIYSAVADKNKKQYRSILKDMKWLLNHKQGIRYRLIKMLVSILGVNITGYLLKIYLKVR